MAFDFEGKVSKKRSRKPSTVIRKILEGEYNGLEFRARSGGGTQASDSSMDLEDFPDMDMEAHQDVESQERFDEGFTEVVLALPAQQLELPGEPERELSGEEQHTAVPRGRRSGQRRKRLAAAKRPIAPPLPDGQRLSRRSRSGRHEIGKRAANARWEKLRALKENAMDNPLIAAKILVDLWTGL